MEEFTELFKSLNQTKLSDPSLFKLSKQFESLIKSGVDNDEVVKGNSSDTHHSINFKNNGASFERLTSLISSSEFMKLLQYSPAHILPILNALIIYITKRLNAKDKKKSTLNISLEGLLENILRSLKTLLKEERKETPKDKILLGTICFKGLSKLLIPGMSRAMLQRRVLDIFDYAISSCVPNKGLLLQTAVLGPHKLAELVFSCSDMGITERALELAFRLGVEVVGAKIKGAPTKAKWEDLLFPQKMYSNDRDDILNEYRAITMKNYDTNLPLLLEKLSRREPSNFKLIYARTLSANGIVFENNDGDISAGITFGSNISFNKESFTAITTKEITGSSSNKEEDEESDFVQLVLETDLKNIQKVEITTRSKISMVRMPLRVPATLDSIPLEQDRGEPEIAFQIQNDALINLKNVLSSKMIKFDSVDSASATNHSTLPTPRITPGRIITTHPSVSTFTISSKPDTNENHPLTPPLQVGLASISKNTSARVLQATVPSLTSSSSQNSTTLTKLIKRPVSAQVPPDSAAKRAKIKNVTFTSSIEEAIPIPVAKTSIHPQVEQGKGFNSNPAKITESLLKKVNLGLDESENSEESSVSSSDDDEILEKALERLSGSAIRKILARTSKDLLGIELEEETVMKPVDYSTEVTQIMGGTQKEVEAEDFWVEVEQNENLSGLPAIRSLPRINLIQPTPRIRGVVAGGQVKKFKGQKTSYSTSQSRSQYQSCSQQRTKKRGRVMNRPGKKASSVADQDLADILGALSTIVLQKLAANSENAVQSFNESTFALESSARKLALQFYDHTEAIIQSTKEALNLDRVRVRNETISSIKRSSESTNEMLQNFVRMGTLRNA